MLCNFASEYEQTRNKPRIIRTFPPITLWMKYTLPWCPLKKYPQVNICHYQTVKYTNKTYCNADYHIQMPDLGPQSLRDRSSDCSDSRTICRNNWNRLSSITTSCLLLADIGSLGGAYLLSKLHTLHALQFILLLFLPSLSHFSDTVSPLSFGGKVLH